jgi:apolipoprotein N-acyltransferase
MEIATGLRLGVLKLKEGKARGKFVPSSFTLSSCWLMIFGNVWGGLLFLLLGLFLLVFWVLSILLGECCIWSHQSMFQQRFIGLF